MSRKLDNETVDAKLEGRGIKRIGEYVNNNTKIEWECEVCGNRWETTTNCVLNAGTGCPKCSLRNRKVCGGSGWVNDYNGRIRIKGKMIPEYRIWDNMKTRCTCEKFLIKNENYRGCDASDEFKHFSSFYKWVLTQGNVRGLALEKDLLKLDNKIYSAETCVFVPQSLNNLFLEKRRDRIKSNLPVGVSKSGKTYIAKITRFGKGYNIGSFDNVIDAEVAYINSKIGYVREYMERLSHKPYALDNPDRFKKVSDAVDRIIEERYKTRLKKLLESSTTATAVG